jgi:ABC-type nitrate/sulfonate/bicarbonate transport system substrate-binding protein
MKCEGRRQIHNHRLSCEAMFRSSRAEFLSVQFAVAIMILFARAAFAADVTIALPTKSFQMIIFPLALERGYMKEEGVDLKVTFMEPTPSIQALVADSIQLTGSGGSALVAIARGGIPAKVVLAVNDRVHQWILSRPEITTIKDLKGRKIATTGIASVATYMFKNLLPKYGIDGNKDVLFTDPGVGNQAAALLSGAVDAAIVSVEQRYAGIDNGMKELMYLGNEVKNSWGTTAASDKFMKEQPKLMAGFMRATLKALRWIRRDRPGTIGAFTKFSGLPAASATRMYDDLIGTFTANGAVDLDTQKNDVEVIRQVLDAKEALAPARAFDFSFALEADAQLNKIGWKP